MAKGFFNIDRHEAKDIIVSWLVVSVAFGWVMKKSFAGMLAFPMDFAFALVVAMVAVGTGFILHELAHRTIAIHFGAKARYVAWKNGLILALALAFLTGFVFAAPGAVYIFGRNIDRKQNGLISLAGPATNTLTAIIFLAIAFVFGKSIVGMIAAVAASINIWLAAFNLIPIFPLDGSKVFAWQPIVWAALFFPLVAIAFFL